MKSPSLIAYIFACVFLLGVSFLFYPKWEIQGTEATISWDVAGYYWYLPAFIIYKDAKGLSFNDTIFKKYNPVPELQQAFKHPSGNYVMKYASGMAVQYFPFFLVAHTLAEPLGFPADGFSRPYQLAVQLGGVLFAILGLWYFRKVLLYYFEESTVALLILLYVLGTNYLNYAAIDVGMTHSWLFTWYCLLFYRTHLFYQRLSYKNAMLIGFCIGIMALTRPTEIVAVILPGLWGLSSLRKSVLLERLQFIQTHFTKYIAAAIVIFLIGSIQLIYWKYAADDWIVYSYGNEGFDWRRPHIRQYMISYRTGWLVYTPLMIFSFIGFIPFVRRKENVLPIILFVLINTYIVVAWQTWWYGGRAMVQSYVALAFPFAAFIEWIRTKGFAKYAVYALFALFTYYNLWWTYQVHGGGLIDYGNVSEAYFWKVVLRYKQNVHPEVVKLYDTDELYLGERKDVKVIYENDFENDTALIGLVPPINGNYSEYINAKKQRTKRYEVPIDKGAAQWLRAKATFRCTQREWDYWRTTHWIVRFMQGQEEVKRRFIRVHRLLADGATVDIHIDVKLPKKDFDRVTVHSWNADSDKLVLIDDLRIETFNEK